MAEFLTMDHIEEAVAAIRKKTAKAPKVGLILGSGLGSLADSIENPDIVTYDMIPNWPVSTVVGHVGRLVIGELEGQQVLAMQGRIHFYEGYDMTWIGLPIRVMKKLGVETLVVTNAAGGINPEFNPGELMMLTDHINLLGMTGPNPLRGPNLEAFGPRFPDMSQAYDREYHQIAREVAADSRIGLHEGIYICLSGPSFETPADLRFLRGIGVDAVGMSTVPEVIVARHSGIRVLGISGISNKANLDGSAETTHDEVLEAGLVLGPKLETIVRGFLRRLG